MAIIEVSKQITNYLDSEQTASAPANPVEGQRWTDTSKSPPVAMIYTEGEWKPERLSVEVLDPDFYQDLEDTKTEVAVAIEKAEAAEKAGKDAQAAGEAAQSAASEAKQAGENAANLATQATLDAQEAKAKADAIQIDVNGLVSDVATINGTVTSISSKANEAYEKAAAVEGRTATLETSVTGLTGRMTDIETTSTSTTKKLNELVVTVDGQKQTLATVTTTAESALNKANVLETTVDGVTQTLTSVETTANSALSKVNTVSSTVDGHTQLIASTKTTADSALSKAVATETTVNGLKTTVSSVETTANSALSKALQIEATANGLTTKVTAMETTLENSGNPNLLPYGGGNPTTINGWTAVAGLALSTHAFYKTGMSNLYVLTNPNTTERTAASVRFIVKPNTQYTFKFTGFAAGNVSSMDVWWLSRSKGSTANYDRTKMLVSARKLSPSKAEEVSVTFTTNAEDSEGYIRFDNNGSNNGSNAQLFFIDVMMVEGTVAPKEWSPAYLELATSSQFTQLSDQMNFKLTSSDGGVTQIDMQNQIVTISSENIYLTGKSNISDAIIKTAHIADLAVSNGKIANLAVTEGKIGNLAVTTAKIADLAVNNAKIASLDAAKINTGYLAAARIAASSITTDKLNVATLSAITANLGNVTAGTINGLEIIGGSYTQSATMTDPNSGKSGISEIKIASGVLTNSFNSTDSSVSRQTTLSSGVLRFLNLGSEFGRLQSNSDKGSSTVPALEISGTFVAITSSQRGWINLSANGVFEGNTYNGYSVDAGSNTGNYIGFNRNSSDKMNFFVGKTADGTKRMGSDDLYASSGSGKALHITSGGSIVAYSSSERFKEYIETAADVTPKSLLNLDLKSWIYKSSHSLVSVGEPIRRVYGLIAEDVERVGLNQYVERDINGRVEGYKPELWTVTIPILKEHEESIETLKQKVEKLEEKIEALQAA
ncbi:tail fiber domain-containing protein [Enterococcus casseliflavus]|uniref:tail fiber domain-containing protein n=1 Tax=Enterococcus casseliflavus TaxID=37734 RepID=UPI003D12AADA